MKITLLLLNLHKRPMKGETKGYINFVELKNILMISYAR